MDPLVQASVVIQKFFAQKGGLLMTMALAFGSVPFLGEVRPSWALALYGAALLWTFLGSLRAFLARSTRGAPLVVELSLFLSLMTLLYGGLVLLQGKVSGPYYPILYVAVLVAGAYGRPVALVVSVGFATALDVGHSLGGATTAQPTDLALRALFLCAVSALHLLLFRGELARVRALSREHLESEKVRLKERARAYRLSVPTAATQSDGASDSGALEVTAAMRYCLTLLGESLELRTVAFLLLDSPKELIVHEGHGPLALRTRPIPAGEGVCSVALHRKEPIVVTGARASHHAPVYESPEIVGAVAVVPVLEDGQPRGLLYVDRAEERAINERELGVLSGATEFILRTMQNERVFFELSRASSEQAKLYRAAEALASAKSEAEVIEVSVESARGVASFDYAAVTLFYKKTGMHEICAVSGEGADALVGRTFRHNAGLVSMVVANRHALPYRGEYEPSRQTVFARGHEPPPMPSLLVLPLIVHERVLGTLVLGSKEAGAFSERVRPALEVLASHMAVSLANARMLKRLEEQATTDGMTGLLNKRTLITEAEKRIKVAARFKKPLSILVTDIDHFKKVNDTYGHDMGDIVIKGLGEVLKRAKRDTDIVGRFGGEEFVVVCEQTDQEGALLLAERVRRELEATIFQTELGPLKVTCSVGVATFPAAGQDWESLFKATDEALYVSKRGGRNQVTVWSPRLTKTSAA